MDSAVDFDTTGLMFESKERQVFYIRYKSSVRFTCYGRPSYVRNGYPIDVKNLRRKM